MRFPVVILIGILTGLGLLLAVPATALAQEKTVPKAAAPAKPKEQAAATAQQPQVVMPDAEKIVLLLRSTLNTLNDAIQTGNYTVLRDKGAPGFSQANNAARLSQSFSDLASRGVDLAVVNIIAPQLTDPPALDQAKGFLRLKGYFPGQPVQINFEVIYQAVNGRWRLFGLSVQPAAPLPEAASAAAPPAAAAEKR
jgi:hypothetical protein